MTPKAVYWDMDGTLIDSEPLHEQAMAAVLRSLGITPPTDLYESIIGIAAMPIYEKMRDRLGLTLSFDDWIARKYIYYMERVGTLAPREGAVDTFLSLRAQGVPQAVVSNSDRLIVEANMRVIGIDRPGMKSVARNDVRLGKPDPEAYLRAAWLTGVDPSDSFVVEDTVTGSLAGLAAGMRTLFWPQQPMEPPAGAILVGSVEELKRHLGAD